MNVELLSNLRLFSPELVLVFFLVVLFVMDAVFPATRDNKVSMFVGVAGFALAALAICYVPKEPTVYFSGLVSSDPFSNFFRYVFFATAALCLYIAYGSKELEPKGRTEFTLILFCLTFGLSLMAISTHCLMIYIGIETVSILSFALAGFSRGDMRSNEASFKYLVFGALASGLMIYGFSLIYGYTGSLQYGEIAKFLHAQTTFPFIFVMAALFIYAGFAYKISAFPMHFWTPDVYEGAPTPVVTFFSVGPKAAGFAALLRFIIEVMVIRQPGAEWVGVGGAVLPQVIAFLAACTMIVGNFSAIGQTNVKRMLAYSSIAHVGYMLMGVVTLRGAGISAILFYVLVYCLMNIGAFWIVSIVAGEKGSERLDAFHGVGWSSPVLGTCMAIFLFSLTGIPLFAGFVGKFLLFSSVLQVPGLLWLALVGVINSVVSLYYYAKILKAMWFEKPAPGGFAVSLYDSAGIVALAVPTVIFGLFFSPLIVFVQKSIAHWLGA